MRLRPPVLCILLLAGCASSEPQNASYAPLPHEAAPGPMTMPPPPPAPAQTVQGHQPAPFPANGIAAARPPVQTLQGPAGQGPAGQGMAGQMPAGQVPAGQFPANGIATPPPAPALQGQPEQVPPNGMALVTPGCRTVDDVTLCDVPYEPDANGTDADETYYTN